MRRWTLRVLCWLALGAVVNVAVTSAIFWQAHHYARWGQPDTSKAIQDWSLPAYIANDWPRRPNLEIDWMQRGWTSYVDAAWGQPAPFLMIIDSFGWPARCARRVHVADGSGACPEGWRLSNSQTRVMDMRLLPTHPLVRGFTLNTLFYALPIALLWFAPGTFRRWHRRRHRLCLHCAYPVADPTKPCPECGNVILAPRTGSDR
jgi:hypothetical protein